jgi:Lon protease-like protein
MMDMPLFPLKNVVLFPGMVMPLHIFELRYREMINRCVDEHIPFGIVLIDHGQEVGVSAQPHMIGTAARIVRVERLDDGCMNITTVGTQRFRILELKHNQSYLAGTVCQFPVVNGATKLAGELAQRVRPQVMDYVELLSRASNTNLRLDRLPEDPLTLAFMIAIALQVKAEDKQKVLEQQGIPEILSMESRLISRETKLLEFMMETQQEVLSMNSGPTGYVFPN